MFINGSITDYFGYGRGGCNYSDSSVIDTVICAGRVLMRDRHVPGEEEILERARKVCRKLAQ